MNIVTYNIPYRRYTYRVEPVSKIKYSSTFRERYDVYLPGPNRLKEIEDVMGKKGNSRDSLGDRMKSAYESISNIKLTRRMPLIIRLDGKAFHTFTKKFDKPFDSELSDVMAEVTKYLVENVQGCKIGYTQSDEISLLLTDYDSLETDAWFDKKIQKICSVSAAMATMKFMKLLFNGRITNTKLVTDEVLFDSRTFVIPKEEVTNYLLWRQQDSTRNSVQMLAQSKFSHKQLQGKNNNVLQDMLMEQFNINWNDIETRFKRGLCAYRTESDGVILDTEIPIFSQDREYIEKFI